VWGTSIKEVYKSASFIPKAKEIVFHRYHVPAPLQDVQQVPSCRLLGSVISSSLSVRVHDPFQGWNKLYRAGRANAPLDLDARIGLCPPTFQWLHSLHSLYGPTEIQWNLTVDESVCWSINTVSTNNCRPTSFRLMWSQHAMHGLNWRAKKACAPNKWGANCNSGTALAVTPPCCQCHTRSRLNYILPCNWKVCTRL